MTSALEEVSKENSKSFYLFEDIKMIKIKNTSIKHNSNF